MSSTNDACEAPKRIQRGAPRCAQVTPRPMNEQQQKRVTDMISKTLPHLPRRMFSTNEHNTMCFASHLRGDMSQSHADTQKMSGANCSHPPPAPGRQHGLAAAGDYGLPPRESTAARKLKIRGLKNFVEKRGYGVPPNWVKEFPCRSRFHPDMYLYNFEDGPLNPKRNVEALSQCQFKGGRCPKCGIYTAKLCGDCTYCEADCECPESPSSNFKSKGPTSHLNLNPFGGMPSMDSFGETLSKAHEILTSSQNAPNQYPFRHASPKRNQKDRCCEDVPRQGQPPAPSPLLSPPAYPTAYSPYPYGYPPLPYMIPPPPPPPIYGYPYPPPPVAFGYPQPPLPLAPYPPPPPVYGYPYQQPPPVYQPPPQPLSGDHAPNHNEPQTTCRTRVSVNNEAAL